MTADPAWERWEARGHVYYDGMQAPQLSAPTAPNLNSQTPVLDSYVQGWNAKSHVDLDPQTQKLPPLTDPYTDASTYQSRSHERHSPSTSGHHGPQKLNNFPGNASSWQSLRYDHDVRANDRHIADAPLTLQIPKTQELPRISPSYTTTPVDGYPFNNHISRSQQQTTSLPSFASFQEHAGRANELEEVDVAPMSSRVSCYGCTKLKSMVKEVATAVAELDESVASSCSKPGRRTDFPKDDPIKGVYWILERLKCAKEDLQAVTRGVHPQYGFQQTPGPFSGMPSRTISPSNPLKRHAERWDQDDLPMPKRPRSGASPDETYGTISASTKDGRRASLDFTPRDPLSRPGVSPPPSESIPGSAYPRMGSPVLPGRPFRALPSPSSLAYPPSAAPSIAPQTAQSTGSPTTSYQPAVSIHTASTNSATSAHIADLQHQVTLKSLALQTLQSEYASLLQKLQRLNVKSQTIEKKTNVAEQEVNDLTGKNEDLAAQVSSLESALEDSEQRRGKEREDSCREKDQWLQMLQQGRRLVAKNEEDKKSLTQRIAALLAEKEQREKDANPGPTSPRGAADSRVTHQDSINLAPAAGPVGDDMNDVVELKAKIEVLRHLLEEARRHNRNLNERAHEVILRSNDIGSAIDRALDGEKPNTTSRMLQSEQNPSEEVADSTPRAETSRPPNTPQEDFAAARPRPQPQLPAASVANFARDDSSDTVKSPNPTSQHREASNSSHVGSFQLQAQQAPPAHVGVPNTSAHERISPHSYYNSPSAMDDSFSSSTGSANSLSPKDSGSVPAASGSNLEADPLGHFSQRQWFGTDVSNQKMDYSADATGMPPPPRPALQTTNSGPRAE